jgi:hypothetical protein
MTEEELRKYYHAGFHDGDQLLAIITRQLTRIADAQEQIANPIMQVGEDGIIRKAPAPDATKLVRAAHEYIQAKNSDNAMIIIQSYRSLESALAEYERTHKGYHGKI